MNAPSFRQLSGGMEPPELPSDLQERVLAPARAALSREAARDWWYVLYAHRGLRVAWAVTIAVLVFGHLAVSVLRHPAVSRPSQLTAQVGEVTRDSTRDLPELRLGVRAAGWDRDEAALAWNEKVNNEVKEKKEN